MEKYTDISKEIKVLKTESKLCEQECSEITFDIKGIHSNVIIKSDRDNLCINSWELLVKAVQNNTDYIYHFDNCNVTVKVIINSFNVGYQIPHCSNATIKVVNDFTIFNINLYGHTISEMNIKMSNKDCNRAFTDVYNFIKK